MLQFITQKLLNKKWLILSILIGNVLLVAIASCNPMYTKAAKEKMLTTKMDNYLADQNKYPGMVEIEAKLSTIVLEKKKSNIFPDYTNVFGTLREMYGIEPMMEIAYIGMSNTQNAHFVEARGVEQKNKLSLKVASLTGLTDHIEMIAGEFYKNTPDSEGIVDAIINESVYIATDIVIGDVITFDSFKDSSGNPLAVRVVGVFRAKESADAYWTKAPLAYNQELFVDQSLFCEKFFNEKEIVGNITGRWDFLFDYMKLSTDQVPTMLDADYKIEYDYRVGDLYKPKFLYHDIFMDYQQGAGRVGTTMFILQCPILVLLAVFIFMVSNQVVSIEQGEISILKSRGVSKLQLITTYFVQSAILALIGLIIGIPLGYVLCHLFGSTNAFLEFVGRKAMRVTITGTALLYGLIVSVASIFIMTLPVLKYARFTIVEQKANKRKHTTPLWQRVGLDFILLGLSLYGFYNFNSQKKILIEKVANGEALDPMLFLAASLFILSCAIVLLRLIPLLATLIFKIGRRFWKPAAYASFLQIMRDIRKQNFITVFLVLTIALGIFNANIARTVNNNEEMRLHYETGADIIMAEKWVDNSSALKNAPNTSLMYTEPDYTKYEQLKEAHADRIAGMARVLTDRITVNFSGNETEQVQYFGINTYDFGSTAWMPDGVTEEHWFTYLNALSENPEGAIVSTNYANKTGVRVGDTVSVTRTDATGKNLGRMELTVVAIMPVFPTYQSRVPSTEEGKENEYTDNYFLVSAFANLSRYYPATPYQVWLKINGNPDFVYDWATENKVVFDTFTDYQNRVIAMKNDPYFQVTNGMLTISFIVVLVLCAIGFLIYWLTNIRSRELIFGIYRAMGMSMGELIRMLINEHFFGSLIPILFGAAIGILASKMFIPLIEIAYSPAEQTLPTKIFVESGDICRISVVVGLMLVGCLAVISVLLSKIKINQALKLGED
ncbi:MAG: ABC transporter permease, partial [Lachnospiraceae bacterium]|nr:ABC transporter permease [Lachnospiraceae bacterium]